MKSPRRAPDLAAAVAVVLCLNFLPSLVLADCAGLVPITITYESQKTVNTDKERRSVYTRLFVNENGALSYAHTDSALGSLNASTEDRSEDFDSHKKDPIWFQPEAIRKLANDLVDRGVLKLKSDSEPPRSQYPPSFLLHLALRCRGHEHQVTYWTDRPDLPLLPAVSLVHGYISQTLRNVALRQSRLVTQGDTEEPIITSIALLLKDPSKYHGKRIKVEGQYDSKLEYSNLADFSTPSARLWVDTALSTFGDAKALNTYSGTRVSVEGVFVSGVGRSGHFGGWDGELKRVTRVDTLK